MLSMCDNCLIVVFIYPFYICYFLSMNVSNIVVVNYSLSLQVISVSLLIFSVSKKYPT